MRATFAVISIGIAAAAISPALASGAPVASAVQQAGRDYFVEACASCHGIDARGEGPVAVGLATKPPDLTTMASRRGGDYPYDELASYIDGRKAVAAHGSRDMPVWGERFADAFPADPQQERIIHGKVLMLLVYLESIQR